MEFNVSIKISNIIKIYLTSKYLISDNLLNYDSNEYFNLKKFVMSSNYDKSKNNININNNLINEIEINKNDNKQVKLFTNRFLNIITPVKLNDIKTQKQYIEHYIQYKIHNLPSIKKKLFTFNYHNIIINVYCSGHIDGIIETNENKILVKILLKKLEKNTYDLSFLDKLKLQLYISLYDIKKIIVFQFSNNNLQPFPIYYENNVDIYNLIKDKLFQYILSFMKNIIK